MRLTVLALCLLAQAAVAETPMTGEEFDAYATGKTVTFAFEGEVYGVEQYLPNRRVRWAFIDDTCRIGYWYTDGPEICFVYEDDGEPQCWIFSLDTGRLTARFTGESGTLLTELSQSEEPLQCTGPDVGV